MPRKYPERKTRLELYATEEQLRMVELLAGDNDLTLSAYVRVLIRREWNASPHLHGALRVGKDGEE
jgi:hypothetical protein